jgi:hypothetical protein
VTMVSGSVVRGLVLVNVATLLTLGLCGWRADEHVRLEDQVPWLNAAVLALIVCGIMNALGVAAARRSITSRARTLLAAAHPGRIR